MFISAKISGIFPGTFALWHGVDYVLDIQWTTKKDLLSHDKQQGWTALHIIVHELYNTMLKNSVEQCIQGLSEMISTFWPIICSRPKNAQNWHRTEQTWSVLGSRWVMALLSPSVGVDSWILTN